MIRGLARAIAVAVLAAGLFGVPALAQDTAPKPEQRDDIPPPLVPPQAEGPSNVADGAAGQTVVEPPLKGDGAKGPDLDAWNAMATRAEQALSNPETTDVSLNLLRAQLTDWREALLSAQSANGDRIATVRDQIAALGPVPGEGETEAPEIAKRRTELNDQLSRLQAPGIAAVEAYRRADGLIREIDRTLRERQTSKLMQIWPAPFNPANWSSGFNAVRETASTVVAESTALIRKPETRAQALDSLPAILITLVFGLFFLLRGRRIMERWTLRLQQKSGGFRRLVAFLLSLGQILLPAIGILLLLVSVRTTGVLGVLGETILTQIAGVAIMVYAAAWLGSWVFPKIPLANRSVRMSEAQRTQGRRLTLALGIVLGFSNLVEESLNEVATSEAAMAVLQFPAILAAGFLLYRMGRLLHRQFSKSTGSEDSGNAFDGVLAVLSRGISILGIVAPLLGGFGYVAAAGALVFPAIQTLALVALLVLLQRVAVEIYAVLIGDDEGAQEALVPVLMGFALVLVSLPVFALVWGARVSDITELWNRFQEGFQIGQTKVSPADFVYFVVIFAFGYTITRLLQGALRSTVLPRTALDPGGQTAVISGVGYIGIFVSALIAIDTAGIDLSGLAIVAGALSVGIGFGLQTIVGNFVSGIILLVERPVSEGDWIEVGGVQGTVKSISVRSTRIQTFDRSDVIVPNQDLIAQRVTNWTRFSLSGRLIVPVGVAYGSDTRKVERVLREIAEAQPLALLNPPPMVVFMGFTNDALTFEIRVILRDVNFSLSVRNEINHQIVERFAQEGITIPFAQRDITLVNAAEVGAVLRDGMQVAAAVGLRAVRDEPVPAPLQIAERELDSVLDPESDVDADNAPEGKER
ncbi:DUF3772 domain-containing protein [Neotabrizicola shimadae]|uniref:Mechanosensitive ion channel family protein n=1 Tax=Neotabrizicola shimadae TaxID=2807096 RepID=A0A8G0ZYW4_9RHOB|nr:DUF3772 domain-containing protein [Neotabrizicola shimadae]QYZ71586.1 mechanosensitive ion channel family protein [Neotabrizicola shimadae]